MMLMRASNLPDILQIKKLIISSEEWDRNIQRDLSNSELGKDNSLSASNPPELEARAITETEETTGPQGVAGDHTQEIAAFDQNQTANLQECYGCKPGKTTTEYLWQICPTREDRILLNHDEVYGFWGPDVFFNSGPK